MDKYAIIDLGSNTIRLVIFEVYKNGSYKLVESLSDMARLGHGVNETGMLSDESMLKAIETISVFVDFCNSFNVPLSNIHTYATAAIRLSNNGKAFAQKLNKLFELEITILSGTQEALYSFNAVRKTFDQKNGLIVDIGGGSTEIVRFEDGVSAGCVSLPYGCVSATELFLGQSSPPTEDSVKKLISVIRKELEKLSWLDSCKGSDIYGIGGTIRAFGKIHMRKYKYPYPKLNGYRIPSSDLMTLKKELLTMNKKDLNKLAGLSSDRRDIVLGGLLILCAVCSFVSVKNITLSGAGLREGVFFEMMQKDNKIPEYSSALEFGINNIMLQYNVRKDHARHVSYLSKRLFCELTSLHNVPKDYINYLNSASLIHDAGIHISYYNHNRHSLYLILNSPLFGLDHKEQLIVAITASGLFGQKLKETLKTNYYKMLSSDELYYAKTMALFVRIAEALDKSETGCIKDISCEIHENKVIIKTIKIKEASIELRSAAQYSPVFRNLLGRNLDII